MRGIVNNYVKMVERYLEKAEVTFVTEYVDVTGTVTSTTLEYANRVGADMIAIMTEQESTLTSLFMGTHAQQMINESKIPVLTVRPSSVLADRND